MTSAQQGLLSSIRDNLWGKIEQRSLAIDVLAEAKNQAIIPLVCSDNPEVVHYAVHSIRVLYEQDTLVNLLREAAIPAVILKGTSAAIYYHDPFRRTMGDIDLLVPPEHFDQTLELLLQKGYVCEDDKEGVRHTILLHGGIAIELHRRFSSDGIDVEHYIQHGMEHPMTAEVDGHRFPMLPPLENGLVLLAHVAQHLRNGLGLRQMIDWMMYVHAQLADEFWETAFRSAAADCGLETLAITATRLCQKYLGLPDSITWCDGADDKLVDDLLENLLVTGNFGHVHGTGSSVETVATNIKRTGLFRYLQQQGEHNWKAYQEHKALKPLCWAYQIGRYIHRGLGTGRSSIQLAEDYTRSQARYDLLTRLGIN